MISLELFCLNFKINHFTYHREQIKTMGIGRRQFLKLSSLALTGLTVDPLNAVAINDRVYVNKKLGILFHIPKEWGFIAVKDFGKIKSDQIIGEGLEDTQEEIWEELGDPICIATKYYEDKPEHTGVFSPTITLNITAKEELDYLGHESFEELLEMSEHGTSMILKGFKVIKKYEPYYISNCKFYEFDAEYLFEHVEINGPLKVELKVLKTEHNGFYYDFNCHQSKAQNQLANIEFDEFKKSIKLI
ncbi:hypothetical protein [Algoriphagus pacificus]|uniref:Tat (Twin-arginine translocation) pathway signal sequence n=1 Tax=Algoriphagus pacificus TaxID=2811234 RepID=A0ABS3CJS5_9BACT|nr:hypothetical protein [Algoriphagus pacificus]MBN7817353.1 hypothetical protein [Algoriphagus pacificus]